MFFGADRIDAVREMIVAETRAERELALREALPMQRSDFLELFKTMKGYPVTIRSVGSASARVRSTLGRRNPYSGENAERWISKSLKVRVKGLHEFNPMLGTPRVSACNHVPRDLPNANASDRGSGGGARESLEWR
jgi:pyruvate,orthophosphate dikinase